MSKKLILVILVLVSLMGGCIAGYGLLSIVGSTSTNGNAGWLSFGIGFLILGGLILAGAIFGLTKVNQNKPAASDQPPTILVDIPGEVKINQLTCNNCGGAIGATDIKIKNNVPIVVCPWCNASYQISEEPKW